MSGHEPQQQVGLVEETAQGGALDKLAEPGDYHQQYGHQHPKDEHQQYAVQEPDAAGDGGIIPGQAGEARGAEVYEPQPKAQQQPYHGKKDQQGKDVQHRIHNGLVEIVPQGVDALAAVYLAFDVLFTARSRGTGISAMRITASRSVSPICAAGTWTSSTLVSLMYS